MRSHFVINSARRASLFMLHTRLRQRSVHSWVTWTYMEWAVQPPSSWRAAIPTCWIHNQHKFSLPTLSGSDSFCDKRLITTRSSCWCVDHERLWLAVVYGVSDRIVLLACSGVISSRGSWAILLAKEAVCSSGLKASFTRSCSVLLLLCLAAERLSVVFVFPWSCNFKTIMHRASCTASFSLSDKMKSSMSLSLKSCHSFAPGPPSIIIISELRKDL